MKVIICKCNNISHPLPLFAWGIMFLQKMKPWDKDAWSHMAIKLVDQYGTVTFLDANSEGTMMRDEKQFKKQYSILEEHTLKKPKTYQNINNWFAQLNGRKYDWLQIFGLLFKLIGLKKFNHSGAGYKKLICCELIVSYLFNFENLTVSDSDNFDLLTTWQIAKGL